MKETLLIIQIVLSVILTGLILLQTSSENTGQSISLIKPKHTRRGMERLTYLLTFFTLFIFIALSVLQLLI
jgi:protein translocase SecG subunit